DLSLGGQKLLLGVIEIRAGGPAVLQEFLLPREGEARLGQHCLSRREIGFRGRCGRVPFSADPAIARDPSRRTTRRYPTANAVGERRSSCRAQTRIAPDRAWR